MSAKDLTDAGLLARREEAAGRLRRARSMIARLDRQIATYDSKRASQQKFVLGHAVLRAVEAEPRLVEGFRRHLLAHVKRDSDREALRGTPFEIAPESDTPAAAQVGEV
ncbi:hypothetical protein [Telmatospirillum sp.]|uniref:hypothetical protein n=1 Tax=Telmatospirillum sp. TaxID=2079197 RepID=UPI0028406BB5|nr:hypothetical protein [Telmatospirillum sp.]MDR3436311.1 hypothetical protein [Telmatospirillum sp.]